jgi:hypothetical protein
MHFLHLLGPEDVSGSRPRLLTWVCLLRVVLALATTEDTSLLSHGFLDSDQRGEQKPAMPPTTALPIL